MYMVTLGRVRVTVVAVENQCVKYYKRVFVALAIQHAKRMRRIVSSATSLALPYFRTLSKRRNDFQ